MVIGINYNESSKKKNLEYREVTLSGADEKFNSGDFVKDWFNAIKCYLQKYSNSEFLSHSSSVNHFIMDGAKYDSTYLCFKDEVPYLYYLDKSKDNWFLDENIDEGIELFVKEGEKPTWEELKIYCK